MNSSNLDQTPPTQTRELVAFGVVTAAFVGVFLASGTPVPLYNTYRSQDGVTSSGLALTTVVYLAATAITLLTTGRLSDHLGRRPVAIGATLTAAVGCLILLNVHSLPTLMAGRIFQGIACGLASSALGSYVLDTAPARPAWLGAVITSNAPPFAIPAGALVAGGFVQYGPLPRALSYELVLAILLLLAVVLCLVPETVARTPGALASLRPQVLIPAGQGRLLLAVGCTLVATWSLSGFYQAFAPVIAADELGTTNALVVALVFSSIVILSPLGGLLTGRLRPSRALRRGLIAFILATGAILVTLQLAAIGPFLLASAVAGISQGGANAAGMRAVLGHAAPAQRSGLLSTLYLISYAGAAAPGLVSGRLAASLPPNQIAFGYGVLVLLAATAAMVIFPRTAPPTRESRLHATGTPRDGVTRIDGA